MLAFVKRSLYIHPSAIKAFALPVSPFLCAYDSHIIDTMYIIPILNKTQLSLHMICSPSCSLSLFVRVVSCLSHDKVRTSLDRHSFQGDLSHRLNPFHSEVFFCKHSPMLLLLHLHVFFFSCPFPEFPFQTTWRNFFSCGT